MAGPGRGEILELQIGRLMVFAGPATDESLRLQIVRLVVVAGPATDAILDFQFARLTVCWACRCHGQISNGLWSFLGLPVIASE